jgi:hypothetical protein
MPRLNAGRDREECKAGGRIFYASALLKKRTVKSQFIALIGFCRQREFDPVAGSR